MWNLFRIDSPVMIRVLEKTIVANSIIGTGSGTLTGDLSLWLHDVVSLPASDDS